MPTSTPPLTAAAILTGAAGLVLTADHVAPIVHVHPHTLRRLARDGTAPGAPFRIGAQWRWNLTDVRALVGLPPIDLADVVAAAGAL